MFGGSILLNFSQFSTLRANFPKSKDTNPIPKMLKRNTESAQGLHCLPFHLHLLETIKILGQLQRLLFKSEFLGILWYKY